MPGGVTRRRGGPRIGVELSAKSVQNPPEGSDENSPAVASVTSEDDSNKRIKTALIIGAIVSIVWMFFVTARNLPVIYLIALPIIAVLGIVGYVVNARHPKDDGSSTATSEKPKPAKPARVSKPKLTAPEGAVIPSRGLPAARYAIHKLVGRADKVPNLTKRDQSEHDERVRVATRDERIAFLRGEINKFSRPRRTYIDGKPQLWESLRATFAAVSVKSASKTTTFLNCANLDAQINTGSNILLLPMTTVPGDGAMRSGVYDKNTLTVSGVFRLLPDLKSGKLSSSDFRALLDTNDYGVYIIAPDFEEDDDSRSISDFQELLFEMKRHFDRIYMDGGNNLRGAEEAAVRNADQVVFTMFTGITSTKYMLGKTMDKYATNHFLRARKVVEDSIVFVSGLRPGESAEDYKDYAEFTFAHSGDERESDQKVTQRRFNGCVMGVPYDDAIFTKMFCPLELMAAETILGYLELLYELFQHAIKKQHVDSDMLESILDAERKQVSDVPNVEDLYDERHPNVSESTSGEQLLVADSVHNGVSDATSGTQPTTQGSHALHTEGM